LPATLPTVGVVPGVVSMSAGGLFQGSVALNGGGSPMAVEDDGSVVYLSTQSDACMSHDGLQFMDPGPFGIASSSLVVSSPVSSNRSGVVVVFATPLLPFPLRRLESLTAAISVSFDLLFLAPLAEVHL